MVRRDSTLETLLVGFTYLVLYTSCLGVAAAWFVGAWWVVVLWGVLVFGASFVLDRVFDE